jgi:hypothetical protein
MDGGKQLAREAQQMDAGRAWGLGLMGLGGVLGALLLLWLLTQLVGGRLNPGGAVLGLALIAILALPPLAAGYYLWQRAVAEGRAAAQFAARRALLEGDALFRQQAAADLRRLAARLAEHAAPEPARAAARLEALARAVESVRRDEVAWYEASPLAEADVPLLRRYEDALQAELDRLATLVGRAARGEAEAVPELLAAADSWEQQFRRREALLVRGRRGPAVAPEELLRARTPSRGAAALAALRVGDAVTVDFEDYLVHAALSYFAEGRTWQVFVLRDGDRERWLWGAPGGLRWAVLDPVDAPPAPGAPSWEIEGVALRPVESGRATVDVETAAAREQGVAVEYWRYEGPDRRLALLERWPNSLRAAAGRETLPDTIDVWPQSASPAPA